MLRSAEFTASGTWDCPAGVSAVFLTMVGGGGGSPAGKDPFSFLGGSGGAGAGEGVLNMLIPVVPETTYTVTVGAAGTASAYATMPGAATASIFDRFKALGAGNYPVPQGMANAGKGGGAGGGPAFAAGGGRDWLPKREGGRWTGGGAGSGGGSYQYSIETPNSASAGVQGGVIPMVTATDGGGAGGGAAWGGTNGPANDTNAIAGTRYGAGASGASTASEGNTRAGANGAPGYVLLMWTEP